ncbi:helix-turn-helix transcriptional regulator [Exiguobacterium undae]|uniref:helix-turn-helix transcriptional regulator n=1 Tax=Exiguobacterium undae TaxID=169177 RepID=UPI00047A1B60|nr:helix-turn-helix transcriptional regulator [Exiguobacterium undae]
MPAYKATNNRLRQLLDSQNLSEAELSRKVEISKKAMNNYVRGIRTLPLEVAYAVAECFDVTIESLYDWVPDTSKKKN